MLVYGFSLLVRNWKALALLVTALCVWIFWGSIVKIVALRHPLHTEQTKTVRTEHKAKVYREETHKTDGTVIVRTIEDKGVIESGTEKKTAETAQGVPSGGLGGLWLSGGMAPMESGLGAYHARADAILGPFKAGVEATGDLKWRVDLGYRVLSW